MSRAAPRWSLLLLAVLVLPLAAQEAAKPTAESAAARIDSVASELTNTGRIAALSVALMHDGKVVLARNYGRRILEKKNTPVTPITAFAIGSVTKQFTVVAALMLAEEGKLSLTDPVAKWYPDLTRANDITLLDLANHVSGYPDYYPLDFVDRRMMKPINADALIKEYAGGKLDFEPGTRWSYSNTGYIILGRVIERVSGQPLGEFLKQRIFQPAGMSHTSFEPDRAGAEVAHGYTSFSLGPLEAAVPEAKGWAGAAGAIYSTGEDLAKWDLALMEGRLLKQASWDLLVRPRQLADGSNSGYGGGLGVNIRDGWLFLSHGGAVSGFLAGNMFIPGSKSALVVLASSERGQLLRPLRAPAIELFFADSAPPEKRAQPFTGGAQSESTVPTVSGPPAEEAATGLLRALQQGKVDRSQLAPEFSYFLSAAKLRAAKDQLGPLGQPTKVEVQNRSERGGLEVAIVGFTFGERKVTGIMYRQPGGTVEEFLLTE